MDIDKYKSKVKEFLIEKNNYTEESADKLIELYKDDFETFLKEGWSIEGAATAMMQGY